MLSHGGIRGGCSEPRNPEQQGLQELKRVDMCPRAGAMDGCSHIGSAGCYDSISTPQEGHWSGRAGLYCAQITEPGLDLACEFSPLKLHAGIKVCMAEVAQSFPSSLLLPQNYRTLTCGPLLSLWGFVRSLWVSGKGGAVCQREEVGGRGDFEASERGCEGREDMGLCCELGVRAKSSYSFPPAGLTASLTNRPPAPL